MNKILIILSLLLFIFSCKREKICYFKNTIYVNKILPDTMNTGEEYIIKKDSLHFHIVYLGHDKDTIIVLDTIKNQPIYNYSNNSFYKLLDDSLIRYKQIKC
jgi:hypothetical protein